MSGQSEGAKVAPKCVSFNAWQYEVPEGTFWSWACSCGLTLATGGADPLLIRTMDDAVADAGTAHGLPSPQNPEGREQ